jgi:pimeloyl-ACP methyl ester carboxylesterase
MQESGHSIYTRWMEAMVSGVPVHYAEYGNGTPVLALHGAGVDHREIAGAFEPIFSTVPGFRRLYPDLPGMGRTPAPGTITSNDDVLDLLLGLVDSTLGNEPFLVIGHSYGGYLARGIANRRPEQAVGLALVCPVGAQTRNVPGHEVLVSSGEVSSAARAGDLDPEQEADVVQSLVAEWLRRVRERLTT